MKVNEFLDKLELAYEEPSYYLSGGWGKWNGAKWGWDCICLIKGILWGWNNDKTKPRGGGAVYCSNDVPDTSEIGLLNACSEVSSNFSQLTPGELLYMQGHCGIYIGNGNVIEATAGWDTWRVIKSQVDSQGNRTYNGNGGSQPWTHHGKLPWVDYNIDTKPVEKYFVDGGEYRLCIAKCLHTGTSINSAIAQAQNVDNYTKTILENPTGNAMLKKGTELKVLKVVEENGHTWGSYGNCWVELENERGEKQVEKI